LFTSWMKIAHSPRKATIHSEFSTYRRIGTLPHSIALIAYAKRDAPLVFLNPLSRTDLL
jgi:hypothetical protein